MACRHSLRGELGIIERIDEDGDLEVLTMAGRRAATCLQMLASLDARGLVRPEVSKGHQCGGLHQLQSAESGRWSKVLTKTAGISLGLCCSM